MIPAAREGAADGSTVLRKPTPESALRGTKSVSTHPNDPCVGALLASFTLLEEEVHATARPTSSIAVRKRSSFAASRLECANELVEGRKICSPLAHVTFPRART